MSDEERSLEEMLHDRNTLDDRIKRARERRALEARPRHERELDEMFNHLRERRQAQGLTQAEVADLCNLSRTQITNAESGHTNLSMTAFLAYVDAVGCRLQVVDQ